MSKQADISDHKYAELFKTMQPRLYYYCRKFISDEHQASDIVQEAFAKLLENTDSVGIHTSLEGYLVRTVHNLSLNHIRDSKVKRTSALTILARVESAWWETNGFNSLLFKQIEHIIEKNVEKLPPESRKIFKMSRFQGLSNAEIANRLGISIRTVENHIYRSLRFLRDKLGM